MKRLKPGAEARAIAKKAGVAKYRAVPTVINKIRFDSRAEAHRYSELRFLELAGEILDLKVHPSFELLPKAITPAGVKVRKVSYEADFAYTEKDGTKVVEDVKGVETPVFRLKMNLFLRKYPNVDMRIVRP